MVEAAVYRVPRIIAKQTPRNEKYNKETEVSFAIRLTSKRSQYLLFATLMGLWGMTKKWNEDSGGPLRSQHTVLLWWLGSVTPGLRESDWNLHFSAQLRRREHNISPNQASKIQASLSWSQIRILRRSTPNYQYVNDLMGYFIFWFLKSGFYSWMKFQNVSAPTLPRRHSRFIYLQFDCH